MKAPGFGIELPDGCGTVVDYRTEPQSRVAVACLVTAFADPGGLVDAGRIDAAYARLLEAFCTKGGVRVVGAEDMEGTQGAPGVLGPKAAEAVRRAGARLVGVDSLGLAAEMRAVQQESVRLAGHHRDLFAAVEACFRDAAGRRPAGPFRDFLGLLLAKDSDGLPLSRAAGGLLALEGRLDAPLPPDAKRTLLAFAHGAELDAAAAEAERQELLRRVERHAGLGLLHPDLAARFRAKPRGADAAAGPKRVRTEAGTLTLSAAELDALRVAHDVVDNLKMGAVEATQMVWTGQQNVRAARHGFNRTSDLIDSASLGLPPLLHVARVLGIDLDCYPNLRRYVQQSELLVPALGPQFTEKAQAAVEKAWAHVEQRVCRAPEERGLVEALRRARLLLRLALLEVTPDAYDELTDLADECSLASVLDALAAAGARVDPGMTQAARVLDGRRDRFPRFYECAQARARGMAERTADLAGENGGRAVLICLGFHQPTVRAVWRARRLSYLFTFPPVGGAGGNP
jgi:hypothetical protein